VISFDSEATPSATLIEVITDDRPGLLYDLAFTISAAGCNIELVLVDTHAHRAMDVFYVTRDGRKLDSEAEALLREALGKVCRS
jgi:[protein-PII] uridylyltransferase